MFVCINVILAKMPQGISHRVGEWSEEGCGEGTREVSEGTREEGGLLVLVGVHFPRPFGSQHVFFFCHLKINSINFSQNEENKEKLLLPNGFPSQIKKTLGRAWRWKFQASPIQAMGIG